MIDTLTLAPAAGQEQVAALIAAGRDILASLTDRGIAVRLGGDGRLYASPAALIDEADAALLTAHREAVRAALAAAPAGDDQVPEGEGRPVVHVDVPGTDPAIVEEVAAVLARHPGEDDVLLHLQAGGSKVTMQVGERFRVASGPALTADLEALFQRWTGGAGAPTAIDRPDGARVQPGAQALDVEPIVVTTAAELERAMPDILDAPAVGFDTEGTGLDPLTARLRLAQFATGRRTYLIDLFRLPAAALQPIVEAAGLLIGHNLKFDLRMLTAAGIALPAAVGGRLFDTMLASRLLGAGDRDLRHGLAEVALRHLGVKLDKTEQTSDWSGHLTDDQLRYAARDAAVLLPLTERLSGEIEAAGLVEVAGIEHRALPAVAWLEQSGIPFDAERWLALAEAADRQRRDVEAEMDRLEPPEMPFLLPGLEASSSRWNSPDAVLKLLNRRGVRLPATSEEVLTMNRHRDPIIALLLQHRQAARAASTYGRDYLKHVHPVTGRIHASYHQLGSDAGRASCSKPNLQQVPHAKAYRACFRAGEGRVLVKADFNAIELRIAAEIARDGAMIEAFRRGVDLHRLTAREVLGVPADEDVTPEQRQAAKVTNFGLIYGMGARSLVVKAKKDYGLDLTEEQAEEYRRRFFAKYTGIRAWHRTHPEGRVDTRTVAGRRRLDIERFTDKSNSPVQGTGADGLKNAMGLLFERRDEIPGARLVNAVHDELVVECEYEQVAAAEAWLRTAMEDGMQPFLQRVRVEVEVRSGPDWNADGIPARRALVRGAA